MSWVLPKQYFTPFSIIINYIGFCFVIFKVISLLLTECFHFKNAQSPPGREVGQTGLLRTIVLDRMYSVL